MNSSHDLWTMPIVLGCVSILGLGSALLADGWADVLSWLMLAIPVLVIARCVLLPTGNGGK